MRAASDWVPAKFIASKIGVDVSTVSVEISRSGPLAGIEQVGRGRTTLYYRKDVELVSKIMKQCRLSFGAACRVLAAARAGSVIALVPEGDSRE